MFNIELRPTVPNCYSSHQPEYQHQTSCSKPGKPINRLRYYVPHEGIFSHVPWVHQVLSFSPPIQYYNQHNQQISANHTANINNNNPFPNRRPTNLWSTLARIIVHCVCSGAGPPASTPRIRLKNAYFSFIPQTTNHNGDQQPTNNQRHQTKEREEASQGQVKNASSDDVMIDWRKINYEYYCYNKGWR